MLNCASHSCAVQGWPAAVCENNSVEGTEWVDAMIWPSFRCHHKSGSLKRFDTVKSVTTIRPAASRAGKENNRLQNICSALLSPGTLVTRENLNCSGVASW